MISLLVLLLTSLIAGDFLNNLLWAVKKTSSKAFLLSSFKTFIEGKNKLSPNSTLILLKVKIVSVVLFNWAIILSLSKGFDFASTGVASLESVTVISLKSGFTFKNYK